MCYEEIMRLVKILCYSKIDKNDEDNIKKSLRFEIEDLGRIEHQKILQREARRAEKERQKYGIK